MPVIHKSLDFVLLFCGLASQALLHGYLLFFSIFVPSDTAILCHIIDIICLV